MLIHLVARSASLALQVVLYFSPASPAQLLRKDEMAGSGVRTVVHSRRLAFGGKT
jgi:hypothetical protein